MSKTTTTKLLREYIAARRAYGTAWQAVMAAHDIAERSEDYPKPDPFQNPKLEGLERWQFDLIVHEHRKRERQAYKDSGGREADREHRPALKYLEAVEAKIGKLPPTSDINVFAKLVMYATWDCADGDPNGNFLDIVQGWSKSFGALGTEVVAYLRERIALGLKA
jgi:hypothetical protein